MGQRNESSGGREKRKNRGAEKERPQKKQKEESLNCPDESELGIFSGEVFCYTVFKGGAGMNLYTQLQILGFDRIAFAHSLTAANYNYCLAHQGYGIYGKTPENGGVLEIGFVEENPLILRGEAGEFTIGENSIFIIPPNCDFSVEAQSAEVHRHTCAEFLIQCHTVTTDGFQLPEGMTVTLPLILEASPGSGEIFSLIRAIARAKTAQLSRNYLEEYADFIRLLSKLCALAHQASDADPISPGNRRYCNRVKDYVSENIHRKLTVGEIATAVGISKNYLTNVFRDTEGLCLTEYINRRKIAYMLELIRRYGYTLNQACEHVGYCDGNYVSRVFKHYYGMSFTDYIKNQEEEL